MTSSSGSESELPDNWSIKSTIESASTSLSPRTYSKVLFVQNITLKTYRNLDFGVDITLMTSSSGSESELPDNWSIKSTIESASTSLSPRTYSKVLFVQNITLKTYRNLDFGVDITLMTSSSGSESELPDNWSIKSTIESASTSLSPRTYSKVLFVQNITLKTYRNLDFGVDITLMTSSSGSESELPDNWSIKSTIESASTSLSPRTYSKVLFVQNITLKTYRNLDFGVDITLMTSSSGSESELPDNWSIKSTIESASTSLSPRTYSTVLFVQNITLKTYRNLDFGVDITLMTSSSGSESELPDNWSIKSTIESASTSLSPRTYSTVLFVQNITLKTYRNLDFGVDITLMTSSSGSESELPDNWSIKSTIESPSTSLSPRTYSTVLFVQNTTRDLP